MFRASPAALARSPRKEVVYVQSDQIHSPVCEAMAPRGYLGIEAAAVQRITDWIQATPARLDRDVVRVGAVTAGGGKVPLALGATMAGLSLIHI